MKNTFLVVTSYKAALIDLYLNTRASSDIRHTPGRWFLLLSPYWDNGHHTSDHGCLTNRLFSQTPSDIFSSLHSFKCCFEAGRQAGRGGGGEKQPGSLCMQCGAGCIVRSICPDKNATHSLSWAKTGPSELSSPSSSHTVSTESMRKWAAKEQTIIVPSCPPCQQWKKTQCAFCVVNVSTCVCVAGGDGSL